MTTRTIALAITVLAAAVSCQRSLEGSPCPCVSGYQCCAAEQACYPESTGCPVTVPGALAWTAAGVPSVDQVGNLYVHEENGAHVHTFSMLDKRTGRPRWTATGVNDLTCSTKDVAVLIRYPTLEDRRPAELIGVSTTDGTRRWSAPTNGNTCSSTREHITVVDTSNTVDAVIKVRAILDGAIIRSGRIDGPPSAFVHGLYDDFALARWDEAGSTALQALDLPKGHEGSVRWTARLPLGSWFRFTAPGTLLALTGESTGGRMLQRLALADGGVVWSHATTGTDAAMVGGKWPGIVLLTEGENLVARDVETGDVKWTFPLAEGEGYGPGHLWVRDSGDVRITYDRPATTADPASTLIKQLGADGKLQWSLGPTQGSLFSTIDSDEHYLIHEGVLSRVDPWTGTTDWSYAFVEGVTDYPRSVSGVDGEQVFVRVGPRSEAECASSCFQKLLVLSRRDGSVAWGSEWFAPESISNNFGRVFADATQVYVFTNPRGTMLRTGELRAFRR